MQLLSQNHCVDGALGRNLKNEYLNVKFICKINDKMQNIFYYFQSVHYDYMAFMSIRNFPDQIYKFFETFT